MEAGIVIFIAAVLSMIGSIISSQSASNATERSVRETNQANKDLAAMQNQWNVEQWNRENFYNSPEQQIQRLAAANVNPALAMSNGNLVNTGNASHLESASSAPMQSVDYMPLAQSMSGAFNQAAMQVSQIDVNKAAAENQRAQATKALADVPLSRQNVANAQAQYQQIMSQIDYNHALISNIEEQTYRTNIETNDNHILKLSEIAQKKAQADLTKKELENWDETYRATIDNIIATTNKMKADENLINSTAKKIKQEIDNLKLTNKEKALELESEYGSTEQQIAGKVRQNYYTANQKALAEQAEYNQRRKQAEYESSDYYMMIQRIMDLEELILGPVRAASGAAQAGASVSRASSAAKMVR